jgi:tetratricopeptide (TPR) repeat protein
MLIFRQRMLTHIVLFLRFSIVALSMLSVIVVNALSMPQSSAPPSGWSHISLKRHFDAAQHFQQLGDMEQSAQEYRVFIAEALGEIASGYARLGDYDKAVPLFEQAVTVTPDEAGLLLNGAQAALAHGDFDQAQAFAERVLANNSSGTNPVDTKTAALAHQILGRALLKMYHDKDARKELEKAVDLDPNFENGYALAIACLDMEDSKCASEVFSEMQASFGDTALIHLEFGLAYGESDFPQKAIAEFKKAIAKNDRLPEAHYSLAAAYLSSAEASSLQNAEVELRKEIEVSPKDSLTYAALGHIEVIQHRYPAAENNLKHAITLDPKNPGAYLYLGQMYFEMNRSGEAEASLREAIQRTTDVSRNRYQIQKAHYLLGRLLAKSGHQAEAEAQMQIVQQMMAQALVRDKDRLSGSAPTRTAASPPNSNSIAMAVVRSGSKADGGTEAAGTLEAFEKEMAPPLADSYNNLGAIAASSKDYIKALSCFQRAAHWNPSLEGVDYNWGRAAFMASRFQDAVPPLTRYLGAHPDDSNIRSVLAISLFRTESYDAVIKTLQPILPGIDAVAQVDFVYADSLIKTGRKPAGIERLEALEKRNPEISDVHRALGEAYADGDNSNLQQAAAELGLAVRLNPLDAQAHYDLGKADLGKGDVQAAVAELETAVQLEPRNGEAHAELAAAYRQASRPADAQRQEQLYHQLQTSNKADSRFP